MMICLQTPRPANQGQQRTPDLVINQLLVDHNPALDIPLSFAQLALGAPQLSCQLGCLNLKPAACKDCHDRYLKQMGQS